MPHVDAILYDKLLEHVSLEEAKSALFFMNSYKAHGPDGFQ